MESRVLSPEWRRKYLLSDMSTTDVGAWLQKTDTVLIPTGACEQHGPHCPLFTDSYQAQLLACMAAEMADVPVAPLVWFGVTPYHMGRPGTISLTEGAFEAATYDICRSLIHHGFTRIIFCNIHHANHHPLYSVARRVRYETGALVVNFFGAGITMELIKKYAVAPPSDLPEWHAAELETSGVLAWNERLIDMTRARKDMPVLPDWLPKTFGKMDGSAFQVEMGEYAIGIPMEHVEYSKTGVVGNPEHASAETGRKIFRETATILSAVVKELQKARLEIRNREFTPR